MWLTDDEEWTHPSGAVPTGPRYLRFAEAKLKTKTFEYGGVKRQSAVEIVYSGENMREHLNRSLDLSRYRQGAGAARACEYLNALEGFQGRLNETTRSLVQHPGAAGLTFVGPEGTIHRIDGL